LLNFSTYQYLSISNVKIINRRPQKFVFYLHFF
uniref:Uncharacterized protein n=1 Tax=Brugia timori TaxID=42155 RepID=A0A0R3QZ37_9BILA